MYELSLQLDSGQLDRSTVYTLPNPLPNQDANGVINVNLANGADLGIVDLLGSGVFNDPVPWWVFYIQIEAETGLGIVDTRVHVLPPGFAWTTQSMIHVAAADSLSRENGPVITRGTRMVFSADDGLSNYPAGDHRIVIGLIPLHDGQECCAYQAGLNQFTLDEILL